MTVTFGISGDQLLDARRRHGHRPLLFTLLELYRLVERTLERRLEIRVRSTCGLRLAPFGLPLCPGLN